ncbi:GNAT family N-acetyltransferase [Staphylococcus simiae]|uniref:N-acetyltransferase domain-containing protein n=1 Tax=Staphylococcus simiae CCM 7213 = CCUG 51256 TaxID=911238 RepID=G5JI35_9STAP|nr:GNAT family N-acetyltransferase [Staphylococcus simiae]EHJ08152.1 hypothetical protein SS7213T_05586 [Staphylococcus simiae CCM 7213 = CCUG 51256]PNZ14779.1 N-acetyltransferase [Staphylococcus simiae]SNV82201.1 Phosphinothricin N-acetyltransferase [Staphylococcus simiae]
MIRQANKDDLPYILTIYNDAIINTTAVYTYDAQTLEERQTWFNNKTQAKEPVFVYLHNNQVVGFATYGPFRNWPAYQYTVEHSIYVDPTAKGQGIASKLLQHLIQYATNAGYRMMIAGIDASNEASINLHHKFNFDYAGTLSHVGYKFDRWLDLAFYQLDLAK